MRPVNTQAREIYEQLQSLENIGNPQQFAAATGADYDSLRTALNRVHNKYKDTGLLPDYLDNSSLHTRYNRETRIASFWLEFHPNAVKKHLGGANFELVDTSDAAQKLEHPLAVEHRKKVNQQERADIQALMDLGYTREAAIDELNAAKQIRRERIEAEITGHGDLDDDGDNDSDLITPQKGVDDALPT